MLCLRPFIHAHTLIHFIHSFFIYELEKKEEEKEEKEVGTRRTKPKQCKFSIQSSREKTNKKTTNKRRKVGKKQPNRSRSLSLSLLFLSLLLALSTSVDPPHTMQYHLKPPLEIAHNFPPLRTHMHTHTPEYSKTSIPSTFSSKQAISRARPACPHTWHCRPPSR